MDKLLFIGSLIFVILLFGVIVAVKDPLDDRTPTLEKDKERSEVADDSLNSFKREVTDNFDENASIQIEGENSDSNCSQRLLDGIEKLEQDNEKLISLNLECRKEKVELHNRLSRMESKNSTLNLSANKLDEARSEIARLKEKLSTLQSKHRKQKNNIISASGSNNPKISIDLVKYEEYKALEQKLKLKDNEMDSITSDNAYLRKEMVSYKNQISELEKKLAAKDRELTLVNSKLQKSQQKNNQCSEVINTRTQAEKEMMVLKKENASMKSELLLKEQELRICSGDSSLTAPNSPFDEVEKTPYNEIEREMKEALELRRQKSPKRMPKPNTPVHTPIPIPNPIPQVQQSKLLVYVNKPNVNLRSGPGLEHAVVLQVGEGSSLLVEDKIGEWYRVITPTGSRAFVSGTVVEERRVSATSELNSSPSTKKPKLYNKKPVIPWNSEKNQPELRNNKKLPRKSNSNSAADRAFKIFMQELNN